MLGQYGIDPGRGRAVLRAITPAVMPLDIMNLRSA
jgi:hypothetical protein